MGSQTVRHDLATEKHNTKINSKWMKYLSIRPDTIKFLEENMGRRSDINYSNIFLDPLPREISLHGS